jgi:hypothetical protein
LVAGWFLVLRMRLLVLLRCSCPWLAFNIAGWLLPKDLVLILLLLVLNVSVTWYLLSRLHRGIIIFFFRPHLELITICRTRPSWQVSRLLLLLFVNAWIRVQSDCFWLATTAHSVTWNLLLVLRRAKITARIMVLLLLHGILLHEVLLSGVLLLVICHLLLKHRSRRVRSITA